MSVIRLEPREEFDQVMRANGERIYTLAVRLTGRLSDGQDLAQETFVAAWEHWGRFRGEADASTWLYRICVNRWKNRVRYEKRRSFWKHFSLDGFFADDEQTPGELPGTDAPAGKALEDSQREGILQEAMLELEPQERAILVLRDIEDRPYEEIAAALELALGTVKSRLARSREKLREKLEPRLKEF